MPAGGAAPDAAGAGAPLPGTSGSQNIGSAGNGMAETAAGPGDQAEAAAATKIQSGFRGLQVSTLADVLEPGMHGTVVEYRFRKRPLSTWMPVDADGLLAGAQMIAPGGRARQACNSILW